MKLTILMHPAESHKLAIARALVLGCARHGDSAEIVDIKRSIDYAKPINNNDSDAICCWGWSIGRLQCKLGRNVLIMERPYLGDRSAWVSLGWNGLYGRARFPCLDDGGARWREHFADLLLPWRASRDGYALLLGEIPLDDAERTINFESWVGATTTRLEYLGHIVRFRPHPKAVTAKPSPSIVTGTLEKALAGAAFAVNWNSNAGVDAVLAGTPTVTMDRGAMAWDVTSHDLAIPIFTPDREIWAHSMAFTQWLPWEIEHGEAWEHLRKLI